MGAYGILVDMKKIVCFTFIFPAIVLLSGCSITGSNNSSLGNILKSTDGGKNWETKVKVSEKTNIAGVNVLSMAIDLEDTQKIYVGTKEDGIFFTRNGGESWEKLDFPPAKVYGLAIDNINTRIIYATGVWQGRGKIYKTENGGGDWEEIYTEPADGTVIVSLAISPKNSQLLYAGTSGGVIFKTTNGGQTWVNLFKASGPVTSIAFDPSDDNIVYFLVQKQGTLRTKDGGLNFDDLEKSVQDSKIMAGGELFSIAIDSRQPGLLYLGTDKGIIKSTDFGDSWNALNVLESSREFPIRAIAINPKNSSEIIYSAAQAVYKSIDGGVQWSTSQLQSKGVVNVIQYDPLDPAVIYLGLRKTD